LQELIVVFAGRDEFLAQEEHVARGCLYLPVPEPLPEPLSDVVVQIRLPSGAGSGIRARVVQVFGRAGMVLEFIDSAAAKKQFNAWFNEASFEEGSSGPTRVFWSRAAQPTPPPGTIPAMPKGTPAPGSLRAVVRTGTAPVLPARVDPLPTLPAAGARGSPASTNEPEAGPEPGPEPEPGPADDKRVALLSDQIKAMTVQQKLHLAAHGDRTARLLLLKDTNKTVQTFLLQNPHITLDEVRYIAGFRQATADVLQMIGAHREWSQNPGVVTALVRNPKTPLALATRLLDKLPEMELRRIARSNDTTRGVQTAARKKINEKA
jgi:hypothetical protein